MTSTILPPATIGIIGGGQLGMMTVREAQRMGYRSIVWDPDPACPASRLADETVTATFDDPSAARRFEDEADVVTYEFEHVDAGIVERMEKVRPLYPGSGILRVSQHRKVEKEELLKAGFPVVPFEVVRTIEALEKAISRMGFPVVVKTTTAGYDGKGQAVLRTGEDLKAFSTVRSDALPESVVERFLALQCEVSVIAARGKQGDVVTFPVGENEHRENILHVTRVPAGISKDVEEEALRIGRAIIEHFKVVGVLCIEMFIAGHGEVLVNELAPRPHNSGHYSLDASSISQFEALVRSLCGLPVQKPRLLTPCAMVNLLGKHLQRVDLEKLQNIRETRVHLYGKKRIEPKRKMGHVNVTAPTRDEVELKVKEIEELIGESGGSYNGEAVLEGKKERSR